MHSLIVPNRQKYTEEGGGVEGFGIRFESQSELENLAHERGMLDADIRKKRRVERTRCTYK